MKKPLLIAALMAAVCVPSTGAVVFKAPKADSVFHSPAKVPADLSTATPTGSYGVYSRAGHSVMQDWESLMLMPVDNFVAEVVIGEANDAYVRNPLCYVNNNVWVTGSLSSDGKKISIPAGTVIAIDPYTQAPLALYNCEFVNSADGVTFTPDTESAITYTVSEDGKTISLDNTSLTGTPEAPESIKGIGAFTAEGLEWAGFLDFESVCTKLDVAPVGVPQGLTATACDLVWDNPNSNSIDLDNLRGKLVDVAVDGSDIYVRGLVTSVPEAWAKGKIEDKKATFANGQFMGVSNGYMLYFTPATHQTTEYPDYGFSITTFTATGQEMSFDWNPANVSLTAPTADMIVSVGLNSNSAFDTYMAPRINKFENVAATPKTPSITSVGQYEDEHGPYMAVAIRTSDFSVDDSYMDRSKLGYRVFINGSEEPFEFTPAEYPTIDAPLTVVPLTLNTQDFVSSDNYQNFYIFRTDIAKIEVQMVYTGGNTTSYSGKGLWQDAGVHDVLESEGFDREAPVYDLTGRRVNPDAAAPGIYIRDGRKFLVR